MAVLKNIGILIALCITVVVATEQKLENPPGHEHYQYHGPNNPNYPTREAISEENIPTERRHGHHRPHSPHNSEESEESREKWEHKKHLHHGWNNVNSPQNAELSSRLREAEERRRPMLYPYAPFHYYHYYPNTYPSTNDEEFATIEARRSYHGTNNPNFPIDNSQEIPNTPFHHGQHNPHFAPFHKEPVLENPEIDNIIPPQVFEDPYINGDDDFQTPDETQLYGNINPEFLSKLPSILIDLYQHHHHHHHHHGHGKPQNDEEGSGEEEIIPLAGVEVPLLKDDDQNEEDEENDVVPAVSFRSFLDSRKSIPVVCDALNTPRYSCYNCYNYLVCKPEGGKIKSCKDPYAPYCNNGICSDVPGPECSNL